tara:strand:- start:289 stop:453 length:165 start_codon:yes stop_codon:yes gene_type:complete
VGSFVITGSDSFKPFLTSSIPDLEFDSFAINIDCSNFEVNTNSGHEIIIENIIL